MCSQAPSRIFEGWINPHGVLGDVWEAPFDQWVNLMLDETSALIQFSPAFTVIYLSSLGLTWASSKEQLPAPDVFIGCLEKFLVYSTSRVVLVLPEPLDEERDASSKYVSWRRLMGIRTLAPG